MALCNLSMNRIDFEVARSGARRRGAALNLVSVACWMGCSWPRMKIAGMAAAGVAGGLGAIIGWSATGGRSGGARAPGTAASHC